jgi:hypothetical protein
VGKRKTGVRMIDPEVIEFLQVSETLEKLLETIDALEKFWRDGGLEDSVDCQIRRLIEIKLKLR